MDVDQYEDAAIAAKRIAELEAEVERLKPLAKFGQHCLGEIKECISEGASELDAEALADKAVECGLFQWVAFDPAKHSIVSDCEAEPGDMIYYWGESNDG